MLRLYHYLFVIILTNKESSLMKELLFKFSIFSTVS